MTYSSKEKIDTYLEKSGDSYDELMSDTRIIVDVRDSYEWVEYDISGDTFWIRSLLHTYENREESQEAWEELKDFARSKGCKKIQFTTSRNGSAWTRLFKDMKVIQYKLEINL